jgi:hypothetical protein
MEYLRIRSGKITGGRIPIILRLFPINLARKRLYFFVLGLNRQYAMILKIQAPAAHGFNRGSYEATEKAGGKSGRGAREKGGMAFVVNFFNAEWR